MADGDYVRLGAACFCGQPLALRVRAQGKGPTTCEDHRPLSHKGSVTCRHSKPLLLNGRERMACFQCRPKKTAPRGTYKRDTAQQATCADCKVEFVKPTAGGKYCSNQCRVAAGNRAQAERLAALKAAEPSRRCAWCACEFQRSYGDKRQRYCSERCETARQNRARSGSTHRRRATRFGVQFEAVDRIKVFTRDRWRCQLCLRRVTKDDAELDHIVPMSKGGPHTYANTQCACKQCNRAKGNKALGQLLLIG